jgi:hypothetical protein
MKSPAVGNAPLVLRLEQQMQQRVRRMALRIAAGFALVLSFAMLADAQQSDLADRAFAVLQSRCFRCHGGAAKNAGLDVLNRDILLAVRGEGGAKVRFVAVGKPDDSALWSVIGGETPYMPLQGSPESKAMTADERNLLRAWIEAGAPFPKRARVNFLGDKRIVTAVRDYLSQADATDRPNLRFFSLAHLAANESVTPLEMRYYRAALSKVVNSLTQERGIVLPQPVPGTDDSVYVVDQHKLGWDRRNLWLEVLKRYPYGLLFDYAKDKQLQQAAIDARSMAATDVPIIRADWFIVTASQPPLYYILLDIPDNLNGLNHQLGVDLADDFAQRGKSLRAGFAKSGVSRQNRLVERHETRDTPYYWISYDFKPRNPRSDLVRFPLGPQTANNPDNKFAFKHDGGEIIYSLPNGMQAYMLVKGDGTRLDEGPIDVVFDRNALTGTPAIINGISCMNCHRQGMITGFHDEVRGAAALGDAVIKRVEDLYPLAIQMDRAVEQDRQLFLKALKRTVGPFLQVEEHKREPIESDKFSEPVSQVAERYYRDLGPREVALELGIEKVETLSAKIESNRELLRLGLGTLLQQPAGLIKRDKWEAVDLDGTSLFQDVAVELRVGVPVGVGSATSRR